MIELLSLVIIFVKNISRIGKNGNKNQGFHC